MTWAADCEVTPLGPGVARIAGWALPPDGPIRRVEIHGRTGSVEHAIVGAFRPGVAGRSDRADAPVSGFARTIAVGANSTVAVRVVSTGGEEFAFEPQPVLPAPAPVALPPRPERKSRSGPIRVVAFGDYARHGGAQRVLADLLTGLGADGIECRFITPTPEAAGPASAAADLEVVAEPPLGDPAAFDAWVDELASCFGGFDVAVVDTFGAFGGIAAATRAGVPAVWAVHESVPPAAWIADEAARRRIGPEVAVAFDQAIRDAAEIVFVSDRARAAFLEHVPGAPASALPYGVAAEALQERLSDADPGAVRRSAGLGAGDVVIACLSMVGFGKGQARLAQSFDRIADRYPSARLVMVGDRGQRYTEGILEFIRRSGRQDRIQVLPAADDVMRWHAAADVVVLASSVEMLPRVMIEAMVAGRPVAATDVYGAGEHIADGETGYLCRPDDLEALTAMLDRVLAAGPAEWGRIAAAAAPIVPAAFDRPRWIGRWVDLLRLVAGMS